MGLFCFFYINKVLAQGSTTQQGSKICEKCTEEMRADRNCMPRSPAPCLGQEVLSDHSDSWPALNMLLRVNYSYSV